ncbi:hypothetical protein EW146_g6927 [Bondarzewia mesenterica]|uniref:Uncharacterized protein n=1 Tax=Bondarzewia mesenterica TaxID=1095465 RepID=A0A4S4LMX4_9AGAM|nr:hypothetical protein EW146_g6927 [Bondarzewia mesenterica]
MDENAALFTAAEIVILTHSLEDWLFQKQKGREKLEQNLNVDFRQSRLKETMPDIPLKKARYITKLRKEITDWFEFQLSQKLEALQEVKVKLSADELKKYDELANKWNAATPPLNVQRDLAEKHGYQYIKEFVRQMYRQLSMRVFMLHAS